MTISIPSNLFRVFGCSSASTEAITLEASKNPMRWNSASPNVAVLIQQIIDKVLPICVNSQIPLILSVAFHASSNCYFQEAISSNNKS